jgi:Zn-dependent protease with chaperone function
MKIWYRCLLVVAVLLLAVTVLAQSSQSGPIVPPDRTITHYSLPPDKLAKATAFYTVRVRLLIIDTIFGFALLVAFIYLRIGPRLRDLAERATKRIRLQGLIYAPMILLALLILELPIDIYQHHLSLAYGLSIQHWASWFGDWAKGVGLQVGLGTLAVTGAYALMRRSPRRWWLWFWLISLPVIVFIIFLAPLVIDPMFNHFDPLEPRQPQLVTEIERVVHHGGLSIPRDRMFEMRASDKVTTLNAYVTGLGASKRVVVWDNTIHELTMPQTLYVFGHEMGHYVLNHIWKGLAFTAVLLLVAYYLGAKLGQWAANCYGPRWGIRNLFDLASLPLLILIVSLFSFLTNPISSGFSRYLEHQADLYGMEVTHGIVPNVNQNAAQSFQALGENSLSYPYPSRLLIFWTYDHPAIPDRVQFVLGYKPWDEGKETEFVK